MRKNKRMSHLRQYWMLYAFMLPGLLLIFLFKYMPMGGLIIVFQDFSVTKGYLSSPWVGFENFEYLFSSIAFTRVLKNSIVNSLALFAWSFPAPIILAILLNEVRLERYKKMLQTVLYLPHFISWVVVVSLATALLGSSSGSIINDLIVKAGGESVAFLTDPKYYRVVLVGTAVWKNSGWGTVVYLAALAGIDPALYEAAMIDGANRLQRILHITLPCILSTVVVILILNLGSLMTNSFEHFWLLQNDLNKSVSEVLETYSYQVGVRENRFSYSAAIGMLQSLIGALLLFLSNFISRKTGGNGLW